MNSGIITRSKPGELGLQGRAVLFGAVAIIIQILIFSCLITILNLSQATAERFAYSHRAVTSCSLLLSNFDDALHCLVVALITQDPDASAQFSRLTKEVPKIIAELNKDAYASSGDRREIKKISAIAEFVLHRLNTIYSQVDLQGSSPEDVVEAVRNLRVEVYPYYNDLVALEREFCNRHRALKSNYTERSDPNSALRNILLLALFINCFGTLFFISIFSKSIVRRLNRIADNFMRFARDAELLPRTKGTDEIASLDHQFRVLCKALKEVEAKEKAVFSHLPIGLINCSAEGKIEDSNPQARVLADLSDIEIVDQIFSGTASIERLKSGDMAGPTRLLVKSSGGRMIPCEVSVCQYNHNDETKLIFTLLDVSDREQVEKLREEFVNIVSHDIRSPLTSLSACFDLLADGILGDLNEKGEKIVTQNQTVIERLTKLTEDLLKIAKLESGELKLEQAPCKVSSLLEQAANTLALVAESKNVTLEVRKSNAWISADEDRIIQILMNFLSNAIKYSETGKKVSIFALEEPAAIRLCVQDEGPGIPKEYQERIFERFKQVQRKDETKGSGLGLAICKLFAQSSGGTIGVDSEPGCGSTFWLELPRLESDETGSMDSESI